MSNAVAISQAASTPAVPAQSVSAPIAQSGHSGFTFHDFLNIINPLQHIPVVATIYREITGDVMKPISNILGGALFGGVVGFATSAVDSIIQEATGKDVGGHIMATLGLHHDSTGGASSAQVVASARQATPAAGASTGAAQGVPVPAFLIAEAQADRAAHAGTGPVGTLQPTDLWRSLQRGGTGVTHGSASRPVITIGPPKSLTGGAPAAPSAGAISQAPASQAPNGQPSAAASIPTLRPASDTSATFLSSSMIASPAAAGTQAAQPVAVPAATGAAAPGGIQPLPRAQIPEMMMQALAKYEAMHKAPQAQVVDQVN